MKHTPAPWKYIGHRINSQAEVNVFTICEIYHRNPEAIANARLIAAAPELLDALTGIVNVCTHPKSTKADMTRIAKEAKYLIAKLSQE